MNPAFKQMSFLPDEPVAEARPATIRRKSSAPQLVPYHRDTSKSIRLVLASGSPAKRKVLRLLGLRFTIDAADIDEQAVTTDNAFKLVSELSKRKAEVVSARKKMSLVLGADTVISDANGIIGKPRDADDARAILGRLSGQTHDVVTGLHLITPWQYSAASRVAITRVTFRELSIETIERYVATGEPFGKAGAYGLQGTGAVLVQRVEGEYPNVFGMPVVSFVDALSELGYELI